MEKHFSSEFIKIPGNSRWEFSNDHFPGILGWILENSWIWIYRGLGTMRFLSLVPGMYISASQRRNYIQLSQTHLITYPYSCSAFNWHLLDTLIVYVAYLYLEVVLISLLLGGCFHRSRSKCQVWTSEPSTSCWWTSSQSTTAATSSTTRAGWSPVRPTPRCPSACISTRTRRWPANSGWARSYHSTSSSWPTTSPTNTDL